MLAFELELLKENVQNSMNEDQGGPTLGEGSSQSGPEITQWQHELDNLRTERQKILDRLFDECLDKVLSIREDSDLRCYLTEYSQAKREAKLYLPFLNLCNRALDCMNSFPSDMFRPTSFLDCRFHLSCPMVIETHCEDPIFSTRPGVIIASTVAAGDLNDHSGDRSADLECDKPPKRIFQMRQTLCCGEFKRSKSSLTVPLIGYTKKRQSKYGWGDKASSELSSPDESGPADEAGERPAERTKLDMSDPTGSTSATRAGPTKTSKSKGSRGTCYPANDSKDASSSICVHHAITVLIIDCKLWVRYFDRQGVIQSNGIDFVNDLPRFLVLLFAFQRFDLADWGVITELYPGADLGAPGPEDATRSKLACKVDTARESEGKIIEELRQGIREDSGTKRLSKHLPEMLMYEDMSRYSTQVIRSMLNISTEGCRTLRAIISREMAPLTSLVGADFVKAWLEVVRFHAFLWGHNIEHGHASLWNVMFNQTLKCGVLCDYDFSISQRQPDAPTIDLLTNKYWSCEIERIYGVELEAFIWILPFVFLQYQNGQPQHPMPVQWMTSDYVIRREKKDYFWSPMQLTTRGVPCQAEFKDHWVLTDRLLLWWGGRLNKNHNTTYRRIPKLDKSEDDNNVALLWLLFVEQLRLAAREFSSSIGYLDDLIDDLGLERPFSIQHHAP